LPPLFDLVLRLPVIGPGAHGRLRELWVLAVALAAGLALERIADRTLPRTLAAALILAAGIGLALAPPPATAAALGSPWPRTWWIATLAGAAVVLAALLVPRLRPRFAPLAVAAVTLDLFLLGVHYHPAVPARLDLAPPPPIAYLMQRQEQAPAPFRVSFEGFDLPPNLNALYALWDPRGYDPMRPEDAARMVGWWLGHRRRFYQNIGETLPAPDQAAHDFLAVRFMGTSHERGLPPPWRLVFEGKGGRVWENPEALPLFFMPRTVETFADLAQAQDAAMHGDDFQDAALVAAGATASASVHPGPASTGSGPSSPSAAVPRAGPQAGEVRNVEPRGNGFDLAVDTATGGLVVSSVSYAPGWQARLAGRPAGDAVGGRQAVVEVGGRPAVVEVNGGFLGFHVPPGSHSVQLRYRPRGWTLGLALFAAGLVLWLVSWWGRVRGWRALGWLAPGPERA
jgi:hypothetical protein